MATIRWIVDTSTIPGTWEEYDAVFSNLETAMASAYDLVAAQESLIIYCTHGADNNDDTIAVVIDGWITSVDYTLTIKDLDDTYRLMPTTTGTSPLYLWTSFTVIDSIYVANQGSTIYGSLQVRDCSDTDIKECTLESAASVGPALEYYYVSGTHLATNNLLIADTAEGIEINSSAATIILDNNVCFNQAVGISVVNATAVISTRNIVNAPSCFSGTFDASSNYNVSSDTTAPGTNTVQSFDHSTLFPNAASGDFTPAVSYVSALGTAWGAGAIPWQRDVLVDTNGGGDYSSLAAAEAGEQTIGDDLVLRNEKMVISCTSGGTTIADTTAVVIDANWNTSGSCDFTIQAHSNDQPNGVWSDSSYTLALSNETLLEIYCLNTNIYNAQLHTTGQDGQEQCIDFLQETAGWTANIRGNFLRGSLVQQSYSFGIRAYATVDGGYGFIHNNIFVDFNSATTSEAGSVEVYSTNSSFDISNNTSNKGEKSFYINDANGVTLVNNISVNSDDLDFYVSGSILVANSANISSDGTSPDDSINHTVYDAAVDTLPVVPEDCVIFKDIINNDFRLVSHKVEDYTGQQVECNSAINNGTYLYDVVADCAGKSRQPYQFKGVRTQRAFDIGAWQAPAQITYVVDTDGVSGDYSNLSTAEAGLQADSTDLVSDNLLPTISCQASTGVADIHVISLSGTATSADCFLTCVAALGHRHNHIWDDTKYRIISDTSYNLLSINIHYCLIDYLQVENTRVDQAHGVSVSHGQSESTSDVVINRTIVRDCLDNGISLGSGKADAVNCIVYGCGNHGIFSNFLTSNPYSYIGNNTVHDCGGYGIRHDTWGVAAIENNISVGNIGDDISSDEVTDTLTNNISSDLTGDITGLASTYFTDAANGDFTPVTSAGDLTSYSASANATETVGAIPFTWSKAVGSGKDYENFASWLSAAVTDTVTDEVAIANCSGIEVVTVTVVGLGTETIIDGLTVVPVTSGDSGIVVSDSNVRLQNCLVYREVNKGTGTGIDDNSDQAIIYNSTVVDFLSGLTGSRAKANNVICVGNTTDFNIAVGNWNISSDTSATGFDSHTGETTALFEDYASHDFRLKSTATNAIGGGVDLSADFTDDITGATREIPWDIGAFKYVDLGGVTLVTADGQHAHTVDALDLLQLHILSLVDSYHGHTAEGVGLLQQHLLAVVDAAQAHVADSLILEQIHNLVVAGSDHAHTADNLVFLQQHLLNLFDATHGHTADDLSLLQQHLITVFDSAHSQFADELALAQQHLLTLEDSNHTHLSDSLLLLQQHLLTLEDSDHAHLSDNLELAQQHLLAVLDVEHSHFADNITLIQGQLLAIAQANHSHTVDNLALLQQHLIALEGSTHAHISDSLGLIQQHLITISETDHAHYADSLTVVQQHLLAILETDHAHTAESLTLEQVHGLIVESSHHSHTADNLVLSIGIIFLAINDALQGQTADGLTLEQAHLLAIAEALHTHSAEEPNLTMALILAIADALHGQGAEGVTLTQNHILAAESALHSLLGDNIDLTQNHNIDVADALHNLLFDNLDLLQEHNIDIGDSLHAQTSDNITLFLQGQGLGVVTDAGIIKLTPQRGKLVLTISRSTEAITVDLSAISV